MSEQMRGQMAGDGATNKTRAKPGVTLDRRKLAATLGDDDILHAIRQQAKATGDVEPGDWQEGIKPVIMKPTVDGEERPHGNREVGPAVEDAAIAKFMEGGSTLTNVEKMFALRQGFLGMALRRRYRSVDELKRALQGQSLENSLILQEYAIANITDLTPAQALLGSKITADTAIAIEKSVREAPKTIDFGALSELGAALTSIELILRSGDIDTSERVDGLTVTPDPNPITRY